MNKTRRAEITKAILALQEAEAALDAVRNDVESIGADERESFENLPEGLQASEQGERSNESADTLEEQASEIQDLMDSLVAIQEALESAM